MRPGACLQRPLTDHISQTNQVSRTGAFVDLVTSLKRADFAGPTDWLSARPREGARGRACPPPATSSVRILLCMVASGQAVSPSSPGKRLETAFLYLITPAQPLAGPMQDFLARVLEAGVDMVQLRDKRMEAGPLLRCAEVVRRRTTEFGALFIVNDRVDVALAADADGVHLGQNDLAPGEARRQIGGAALIGLSTHCAHEIVDASSGEADYLGVGPIYPTPTKPGRRAVGVDLVRYARGYAKRPFFAIGGIDLASLPAVLAAGATRISVLRALTDADDPAGVARRMSKALASADRARPGASG